MYRQAAQAARLFGVDAELLHHTGIKGLALASRSDRAVSRIRHQYPDAAFPDSRLTVVNPFGEDYPLIFRNPLGIAAGLDKDGVAFRALSALGFGHVEVGTVTPRPQPGRSRPRVFALPWEQGLINRMGFPSLGAQVVRANLTKRDGDRWYVLGANVGPNADTPKRGPEAALEDYVKAMGQLADWPDYFTINPSSPNTEGLREIMARFGIILDPVLDWRAQHTPRTSILVKFAPVPDVGWKVTDDLLSLIMTRRGVGIIATNTSRLHPPFLRGRNRAEMGGFSGPPQALATLATVQYLYKQTEGTVPIIATGGDHGPWTEQLIRAGATLVQSYTNLVYTGPAMADMACRHLLKVMAREGLTSISELVGVGN